MEYMEKSEKPEKWQNPEYPKSLKDQGTQIIRKQLKISEHKVSNKLHGSWNPKYRRTMEDLGSLSIEEPWKI